MHTTKWTRRDASALHWRWESRPSLFHSRVVFLNFLVLALFLSFLLFHPYLKQSYTKIFSSFCSFSGVSKLTFKYDGFHLMRTLVNVGHCLMWTSHLEQNHLYIRCTKSLWLIWENIWLLWANPSQTCVTTNGFTHVVQEYIFIINTL